MTYRMTTAVVTLGLVVGSGASQAGDRVRTAGADTVSSFAPDVWSAIDPALYEYYRISTNGLVEYAFAPPAEMSPVGSGLPRPAYVVASSFLRQNADALGIHQDPADFVYVLAERRCDGSERVVFEQTYNGIRVDSSSFELVVQAQQVKRAAARFVADISTLPSCVVLPPPGVELRFLPQTGGNIVITITIEGVLGGGHLSQATYRDGCTGQIIGQTLVVK